MNILVPIIGNKSGCYTIISEEVFKVKDKHKEHYRGYYLVKCNCGKEQLLRSDMFKNGTATRCRNCSNRLNYERNVTLNLVDHKGYSQGHQGIGDLTKTQVFRIKCGAKARGIEWNVEDMSISYLWELFLEQDRKCALSGLPISLTKGVNIPMETNHGVLDYHGWNASLDRIASNSGYIKGNVQWLDRNINIMKNVHSEEFFIHLCNQVTIYNNGKQLV